MFYQNNSHMSWEGPVIILKVQLWLFNWTVRLRLAFLFVGMPNYVQFFEKNNSNIVIAFLCMLNFKNLFSFLSFLSFFFFLRTRVIQVTNLQSQAKILGTLRANTVFFSLLALFFSLLILFIAFIHQIVSPTLRRQEDTKVSQQFWLKL